MPLRPEADAPYSSTNMLMQRADHHKARPL